MNLGEETEHPIRVILIEDDDALREGMQEYLELSGFAVDSAATGLAYYQHLAQGNYAVAVIDLGLPDQPGEILLDYTRRNTDTAIIVLTARDSVDTRIASYESGADIFLGKPANLPELVAAIRSLAKRGTRKASQAENVAAPPPAAKPVWKLSSANSRLVTPGGVAIPLSGKECQLLECFASPAGIRVTRQHILDNLYATADNAASRALDTLVRRLRRKVVAQSGESLPLRTVYSNGYSFPAALQRR